MTCMSKFSEPFWTKSNKLVIDNDRYSVEYIRPYSYLMIKKVRKEDCGMFICEIYKRFKQIHQPFLLLVGSKSYNVVRKHCVYNRNSDKTLLLQNTGGL